jgi:hypothetical protein
MGHCMSKGKSLHLSYVGCDNIIIVAREYDTIDDLIGKTAKRMGFVKEFKNMLTLSFAGRRIRNREGTLESYNIYDGASFTITTPKGNYLGKACKDMDHREYHHLNPVICTIFGPI